jgi:hypothetical protein
VIACDLCAFFGRDPNFVRLFVRHLVNLLTHNWFSEQVSGSVHIVNSL